MLTEEVGIKNRTKYAEQIAALHEEHYSRLLHLGEGMTGDYEDACDIIQTVFLNMLRWEETPSDFPKDALAYMCGAVIQESRLLHRRRQRRHIAENVRVEDFDRPEILPLLDDAMAERLRKALAQIRPDWVEMMFLRHVEGYSESEVAEKLDKLQPMVSVGLFRARRRLRKLMTIPGEA